MNATYRAPDALLIRSDAFWPEGRGPETIARLDNPCDHSPAQTSDVFVKQWNALPRDASLSPQPTIVAAVHYDPDRTGKNLAVLHGGDWSKWFTRLTNLGNLKDRWNSYTAPRPNDTAIRSAEAFLEEMKKTDYEPTRLAPSAMGGVAITRRQDNRKVLVEFYNDGRVYALFSDRDTVAMDVQAVSQETFAAFIATMRKYLHG